MKERRAYRHQVINAHLVRSWWILVLVALLTHATHAQVTSRSMLRSGNRAFEEGDFTTAEEKYREAAQKRHHATAAQFNLANALYRQQRYEEALEVYLSLLSSSHDSATINAIAYNLGNTALKRFLNPEEGMEHQRQEYLQLGIEAYSEALRYNPTDEDARHNLALALQHRNETPPTESDQQEQHEQDERKHEQTLPETALWEEERDQHIPEHEEGRISLEDAERMLNAIREKEMRTAEQIHQRERKRMSQTRTKNW